jgi:proteasome lid subunit RPN8/RPN11
MMPAQSRLDAGFWSVPGHAPVIEYARPVLNGILTHVIDAFESYLSGGYEVGGVLFGTHDGAQVRILAFRRLEIQPPRPSFSLSEADAERLSQLLEYAQQDTELTGLEPVGWYHSHTRSEIFLSESDIEIYDRFFPHEWQVAMVLRPEENEPVRIGFFFRESDGFIRTDQSYQEFAVDPPMRPEGYRRRPPWELGEDGGPPEVAPSSALISTPPAGDVRRPFWKRAGSVLLVLGVLAVIAAGSLSVLILRQPEPPLALEIVPAGGRLVIQWNPKSPMLMESREVVLFIQDGGRRSEVKLDTGKLALSRYHYQPVSGRVDVRLEAKLFFGRTRRETAAYVAHPELGKPSPELAAARNQEAEAHGQILRLKEDLMSLQQESAALESKREELSRQYGELMQAKQARLRRGQPKKFAPRTAPARTAAAKELPAAPEIAARSLGSALPQAEVRLRPPEEPRQTITVAAATVPSAPPAVVAPKPKAIGPVSGKLIWTGDLGRNSVLTITGKKASTGFLIGELPGAPVQVGAYPAELAGDGLRVLTPNPKLGSEPRVEPPGPSNGWNKTQYVYDPRALRDVTVEQKPGPENPTRLVLRAGSRKLSVIVIEWRVMEP